MNLQKKTFEKGAWIVHLYYGVGQIEGEDEKILDGKPTTFLKVKTSDGSYWIPIDHIDDERVRPISTEDQITDALALIEEPPEKLPTDHKLRRKIILAAIRDISLCSDAQIIRDLSFRRVSSKFNSYDNEALQKIKDKFLKEWRLVNGENRQDLEKKLQVLLKKGMENI